MVTEETQESRKMKKVFNLLQMCARAGQLKIGFDSTSKVVKQGKAKVVIMTEDFSEKNQQKINRICLRGGIPVYILGTKESFGELFSRKDTGVLATCDKNFAKGLSSILAVSAKQTDQEV